MKDSMNHMTLDRLSYTAPVGIVASTLISSFLFGEKLNTIGIVSLVLIIAGCVILNLYGISKN